MSPEIRDHTPLDVAELRPLPQATINGLDLSRHAREWVTAVGVQIVGVLHSLSWADRQSALLHLACQAPDLCRAGDVAVPSVRQTTEAATELPEGGHGSPSSVVVVLCEIIEQAISDPVLHVVQAGLSLWASLPLATLSHHPRFIGVMEHIVGRCHTHRAHAR